MTKAEMEARIAAIDAEHGRPETVWLQLFASVKAQAEWDEAHPEVALERKMLCGQISVMDEAAAEEERKALGEKVAAQRVASSGLGARAADAAKTPRDTPAMAAARAWLKTDAWCLVLAGDVGNGKTVAAGWVLAEMARRGSVEFRKAAEVMRFSSFGDDAMELDRLKRCGLLVLDDLGAESLDDRGRGLLVELLDARYEARKRTIITANPSWPQLQERLGKRAADRLCDGGRVVELRGKSLRGAA